MTPVGPQVPRRVAVIICTKYGQTTKVAAFVRDRFLAHGHKTALYNIEAGELPMLADYDLVVVGGPVYIGKFSEQLIAWVKENKGELHNKICAFSSISLNAADKRPAARKADDELLRLFIRESGLKPQFVASIAGALHYRRYGFLKRWLLRRISAAAGGPTDTSRDHELTDWSQVASFADALINSDHCSLFAVERRLIGSVPEGGVRFENPAKA